MDQNKVREAYDTIVGKGLRCFLAVKKCNDIKGLPDEYKDVMRPVPLDIGPEAVRALYIGEDVVSFCCEFSGVYKQLEVPMDNIEAVYDPSFEVIFSRGDKKGVFKYREPGKRPNLRLVK